MVYVAVVVAVSHNVVLKTWDVSTVVGRIISGSVNDNTNISVVDLKMPLLSALSCLDYYKVFLIPALISARVDCISPSRKEEG